MTTTSHQQHASIALLEEEERVRDLIEDMQSTLRRSGASTWLSGSCSGSSFSKEPTLQLNQRGESTTRQRMTLSGSPNRIAAEEASPSPSRRDISQSSSHRRGQSSEMQQYLTHVHRFIVYFKSIGYDLERSTTYAALFADAGMGEAFSTPQPLTATTLSSDDEESSLFNSVMSHLTQEDLVQIGITSFGEQRVLLSRVRAGCAHPSRAGLTSHLDGRVVSPSSDAMKASVAISRIEAAMREEAAHEEAAALMALVRSAGDAFVRRKECARLLRSLAESEHAARAIALGDEAFLFCNIVNTERSSQMIVVVRDLQADMRGRLMADERQGWASLVQEASTNAVAQQAECGRKVQIAAVSERETVARQSLYRLESSARYTVVDAWTSDSPDQGSASPQRRINLRECEDRQATAKMEANWIMALRAAELVGRRDAARRTENIR